jgi:uncharacterized membrane protein YgaE (UPF0421/DUF939 family)
LIIKQISAAKSKVLKYLDDIEERLIIEVESVQEKHEEKINKEKHDIYQLTSILKDNKQELEFVKKHGSNNQLFLTLRKQITLKVKQTHKIYGYQEYKLYSIQHHVDYRNNQSGRLCVFHSLF